MAIFGLGKKQDSSAQSEKRQAAWGAWVVVVGLAAIVIIFGIAIARFHKAGEVATAVGSVSGVIAAIIGAYFGLRGSSVAQAQVIEMMNTQQRPQGQPPNPAPDPAAAQPEPAAVQPDPVVQQTLKVPATEATKPPHSPPEVI